MLHTKLCHNDCWLYLPPLQSLGSYWEKTVQVGERIGTHARKMFLFLTQTTLFLDLLLSEWVRSSLNFTSLSAKPGRDCLLALCSVCSKEMQVLLCLPRGTHLAFGVVLLTT